MHLVVRELHNTQPPTTTSNARGQSPAPAGQTANTQRPTPTQTPFGPQPPPGFPRRNPIQPTTAAFPPHGPPQSAPPVNPNPDAAAAFQQQHQNMSNWLTHLQRESMTRAIANQNQRSRATLGMRGIGDLGQHNQEPPGGRASPALGHYYRETTGPNGQTYQVETIIRGSGSNLGGHNGGLSPVEVQNMLRSADMSQATAAMTNAMHRSASGASLHSLYSRPLNQPGVTTPAHPLSDSRATSGRATPDASARSVSGSSNVAGAGGPTSHSRQGVDVYILSSPEGPRGLLVNNNTSETFYTPRLPAPHSNLRLRSLISPISTAPGTPLHGREETQNSAQFGGEQQPQEQGPNQHGGHAHPLLPDGQADPDNPNEAGLPPLLMQVWPHLWLIFRLGIFVWFFTSPQSSWSRWLSVVGMAVFIFVLSIGALHNVADLAWRPFAQQLENMLPRLEQPHPRLEGAQAHQQGENRELAPADMAARLIADRARENWLQAQIRRIEQAGLLFLASIAPGVAERHIANLEAEARAERQRLEAEAAEAARRQEEEEEAAAAAAAATVDAATNGEAGTAAASQQAQETATPNQPEAEGQGGVSGDQGVQPNPVPT